MSSARTGHAPKDLEPLGLPRLAVHLLPYAAVLPPETLMTLGELERCLSPTRRAKLDDSPVQRRMGRVVTLYSGMAVAEARTLRSQPGRRVAKRRAIRYMCG
jgi:hypothetical protein